MKINEKILSAWLKMIFAVDSERLASQLSYNEAIICNVLYSNKKMNATELCMITKIQKSLMNRTLKSLEEKQLVKRTRSTIDKREIVIELINDSNNLFMKQHQRTLSYVDRMIKKLGKEKSEEVIDTFELIAKIAQEEKNDSIISR